MADPADIAQEHIERVQADQLAQRRPAGPAANGACHNCGEAVAEGHRWCDADCREDWSKTQRAAGQRPVFE